MATRIRQAGRTTRGATGRVLKPGVRYDDRAKVFVAYAPSLDVYAQATTEEHARRALESAIMLLLAVARNRRRSAGVVPAT